MLNIFAHITPYLILVLVYVLPTAHAQGNGCTSLSFPGTLQTGGHAINDLGQIVGAADFPNGDTAKYEAFLLSGNRYSKLNIPGIPTGINNFGEIVGLYDSLVDNRSHGFIFDGQFTIIDFPVNQAPGGVVRDTPSSELATMAKSSAPSTTMDSF